MRLEDLGIEEKFRPSFNLWSRVGAYRMGLPPFARISRLQKRRPSGREKSFSTPVLCLPSHWKRTGHPRKVWNDRATSMSGRLRASVVWTDKPEMAPQCFYARFHSRVIATNVGMVGRGDWTRWRTTAWGLSGKKWMLMWLPHWF